MKVKNGVSISLDFSCYIIKGVVKVQVEDKFGWARFDDFKLKELLSYQCFDEWKHYMALPELSTSNYVGAIIEVYENYEGFLLFKEYCFLGDITNPEVEDMYAGQHFD